MTGFFARSFVLTLPRLRERANNTFDHLRFAGIDAEPFYGFDGPAAGLRTENSYELDNPGTGYRIGPKTLSMYLGHAALWRALLAWKCPHALIMEDDARFQKDWREHYDFAMPALPDDWDILYLGSCCCVGKEGVEKVSGHLHRVRQAFCTHAYAVALKALPTLMEACEKVYAPVDIAMSLHALPKLNAFAFLPRLAFQYATTIEP